MDSLEHITQTSYRFCPSMDRMSQRINQLMELQDRHVGLQRLLDGDSEPDARPDAVELTIPATNREFEALNRLFEDFDRLLQEKAKMLEAQIDASSDLVARQVDWWQGLNLFYEGEPKRQLSMDGR